MSRYDVVVVGAGLAGLTIACRLAQAQKKVLLVSTGAGSLLLASGCVDVLGFQPGDSKQPVTNPLDKLDDFLAEAPDHPYKLIGKANVAGGIEAFWQLVNNNASLEYWGAADRNWLLPTAAGAVHPTCLAPTSLANGDLSKGGSMLLVGFRELRDYYPALISQNLNEQNLGVETATVTIDAPAPIKDHLNITPIELARAFENSDFRRKVVQALKGKSNNYNRIGFPAVLGLKQHTEVLADLEKMLGKTVFEISTLPPSAPGRRLFEGLKSAFLQAGGRIIIGSRVVSGQIENGQVKELLFETSNRLKPISADYYVLATGGIYGGGIQTDLEGKVWEPIFGLPVTADENRHKWFAARFVSPTGQPVSQYGVEVNEHLNPVNGGQAPIAENLFVAGGTLAGADWTRGRTGDGLALASAEVITQRITA
ncbi:MAG: glycerol-3-phosphate dehydrogenase subunit GlpB [Anaerolineae bacterium]|nr:glycerol-3-phosphate dehydrogenase subunit GlpB [Anaerolineae bacterium]